MQQRPLPWIAATMLALVATVVAPLVTTTTAAADPGGVVISEIHYHAGSDLDTDDFLELANTASTAVDVSGWSFTQGITAVLPAGTTIPAGGRIVLSPDAARFTALYGFAPDAIYTGKLSNSGETVQLVDAGATVVDTVSYLDAAPWPGTPDGTGPSLELRDLMSDNTLPESWAASSISGGTPRARNSVEGIPAVTQVAATPVRPDPGQPVVVSARMPIGTTATLTYKVMFGAEVTIPLVDDAASPGGAGDGAFAATIPGQAAGQLIRYRVNGVSQAIAIAAPDPTDSIHYLGVVVKNPAVVTQLPVIEWFMEDARLQRHPRQPPLRRRPGRRRHRVRRCRLRQRQDERARQHVAVDGEGQLEGRDARRARARHGPEAAVHARRVRHPARPRRVRRPELGDDRGPRAHAASRSRQCALSATVSSGASVA